MKPDRLIGKEISKKILFLGVSRRSKGGMTSVILSYGRYIESMRFISTWNLGGKLKKAIYMSQAIIRTLFLLLADPRIRIVHIHGAANASFRRAQIFIRISKALGRKVILHEHAADFVEFFNKTSDKQSIVESINACDRLIVLSKSWHDYFSSIGVDSERITVLNNIVSPPQKHMTEPKAHGPILKLLYLGEVSYRKGCYDLLHAIAENRENFAGRLHLRIGGNQVDGDIQEFIREHSLSDIVTYEGWLSGTRKEKCLYDADVYILPSYNEGLPIAILEAMAHAHPVISTPVGGIPEVISDGRNGLLTAPGDRKNIATAIMKYIDSPGLISEHGKQARKDVEPFLPEGVMSVLADIYKTLLTE